MKISIIIPAFNEEEHIGSTIRMIKDRAVCKKKLQIIVVDGGSEDNTTAEAQRAGAKIVSASQTRRSVQMNEGARHADQEILYFLHADTHPPLHFDRIIAKKLSDGHKAGCFRLRFDSPHPLLHFYGWCTRFNIDSFRFGDQSLFVERKLFDALGGYRDGYRLLEGHEIVKRLKEKGAFALCNETVHTSPRKYEANGALRLQAVYVLIILLYKAGLEQSKLHALCKKWVQ